MYNAGRSFVHGLIQQQMAIITLDEEQILSEKKKPDTHKTFL